MERPEATSITINEKDVEKPQETSKPQDRNNETTPITSHSLGRDDEVWPCYVEEAEKWDDILMEKWNDGMDVILLSATLFSAIVTAFVIESSKNLQEDNEATTASAVIEIAAILRVMAEGTSGIQTIPSPTTQSEEFHPSAGAVLVNLAWFISLSLSITVALIAILVKQWCSSFTSDRTSPPCNQARIRQARFNKLQTWRTEVIISTLPIIMHASLGLFLFGLIIFLRDLHRLIYAAVSIISATTLTFYVGTTLMPLLFPFCPYETPLSSPRLWGYFYQFCYKVLRVFRRSNDASSEDFISPCVRAEVETTNRTTPDEITGHALNWLIMHSRKPDSQKMAIRAIAGANSDETLKELLAIQPGIFPQVVQSFTSCFNKKDLDIQALEIASLHGQALAVLAHRAASKDEPLIKWGIDQSTRDAVEEKFRLLSDKIKHPNIAAFGLMGLSSWHDFSNSSGGSRFAYGKTLEQLTRTLKSQSLSPSLTSGILRTLTIESTHWLPNIDTARRQSIIHGLLTVAHDASPQLRPKVACMLAVLALAITHQYRRPRYSTTRETTDAERVSEFYLNNPSECDKDEESLMLLGLAGIMDHYAHCVLDDTYQEDMEIISTELGRLSVLGKAHLISPDNQVLQGFDIRAYIVDVLVLHFQKSQVSGKHTDYDQLSAALLKSINDKPFIWINHGAQLSLPIIQMLTRSDHVGLQEQCLIATSIHGRLMGSSAFYMNMMLSYNIPEKAVRLVREDHSSIPTLLPYITITFECIAERLSRDNLLNEHGAHLIEHIVKAGFFGTIFSRILYQPESGSHSRPWRQAAFIYFQQNKAHIFNKTLYPMYAYLWKTMRPNEIHDQVVKEMLREVTTRLAPDTRTTRRIIQHWRARAANTSSKKGQSPMASGLTINGLVTSVASATGRAVAGNSSPTAAQAEILVPNNPRLKENGRAPV